MNRRARILVVDDEVANIEILNAALEDEYDVSFATSGQDAIAIALATLPDMVLLDVMMPGMDGYEVCRHLKARAVPDLIESWGIPETAAFCFKLTVGKEADRRCRNPYLSICVSVLLLLYLAECHAVRRRSGLA